MEKNKLMIVGLIIVIAILAVGIFMALSNHEKMDTKLTIKVDSPVHEGDYIKVKLMDLNKTPIANQTVNITITDKDNASTYYSVVTNAKGVGKLKLEKGVGSYRINCSYAGNENYTGNSTVKKIKIEKEVVETQTASSSSQYNSDDYVYSAQGDKYVKKSGQWGSDSQGNSVYTYQGSDGVIYERYYDPSGREIPANEYYR